MLSRKKISALPKSPGIYQFYDGAGKLLYIGKSVSIKDRVASYFSSQNHGPKINLLISKICDVSYIKVFSEFEAILLEAELIRTNQPFFNSIAKDDKSPIYIKITNDKIALIELVRKPKQEYRTFIKGPFPSEKVARGILKMIRKIFPYCHHKNPKRPCLYVHLGLCPYPYVSETTRSAYFLTVEKIKKLLTGKSKALLKQLQTEMGQASKALNFERANEIKKQIEKIQYLTTTYHPPREFLEQPTLVDDLTLAKLKDLAEKLGLKKIPKRIECYDISNISGKFATGSMVVFTNGYPDKNQYRRFKIKFTNTANDYEMLREVLIRRLKNDWPIADLMIIDGGRGQLNVASLAVSKFNIAPTVVSLAKRFEEIYVPWKVLPLSLPKESAAIQIAQSIRNEAHRFAISYHRLLRSKNLLK